MTMLAQAFPASQIWPVPFRPSMSIGARDFPVQYIETTKLVQVMDAPLIANHYQLVMAHLPYPILRRFEGGGQIITTLRDPVDQLVSQYNSMRFSPDIAAQRLWQEVGQHGIEAWLDHPGSESALNLQTRYLTGGSLSAAKAIRNLKSLTAFGLVEHFEASIALFEHKLDIDLTPITPQNVTPVQSVSMTPELRQRLLRLQAVDQIVYEFAVDWFKDQFQQIEPRNPTAATRMIFSYTPDVGGTVIVQEIRGRTVSPGLSYMLNSKQARSLAIKIDRTVKPFMDGERT